MEFQAGKKYRDATNSLLLVVWTSITEGEKYSNKSRKIFIKLFLGEVYEGKAPTIDYDISRLTKQENCKYEHTLKHPEMQRKQDNRKTRY